MPTIEERILPELANARVFTKVDCRNGYKACEIGRSVIHFDDVQHPIWQIQKNV